MLPYRARFLLRLETNKHCFACGVENPIGLKLEFRFEPRPDGGEDYVTEFTPRREHQGYVGMTHGGIITTVLDEVMARLAWVKDIPAITAKMEVRLRKPIPVGTPITARGRIVQDRGRSLLAAAQACLPSGEIAAEATAMLLRVTIDEG